MGNKKFYIILIVLIGILSFNIYSHLQRPKIGVVDFNRVVMEFDGMKEAMALYQEKAFEWESRIDTLQTQMNLLVKDLESNEYPEEVVYNKEYELITLKKKHDQLQEQLSVEAQQEDYKLTTAVLNQVMDFVDDFGKENGYDVIYGKNEGNTVLYKSEEIDITDVVLNEMNSEYNGG